MTWLSSASSIFGTRSPSRRLGSLRPAQTITPDSFAAASSDSRWAASPRFNLDPAPDAAATGEEIPLWPIFIAACKSDSNRGSCNRLRMEVASSKSKKVSAANESKNANKESGRLGRSHCSPWVENNSIRSSFVLELAAVDGAVETCSMGEDAAPPAS